MKDDGWNEGTKDMKNTMDGYPPPALMAFLHGRIVLHFFLVLSLRRISIFMVWEEGGVIVLWDLLLVDTYGRIASLCLQGLALVGFGLVLVGRVD